MYAVGIGIGLSSPVQSSSVHPARPRPAVVLVASSVAYVSWYISVYTHTYYHDSTYCVRVIIAIGAWAITRSAPFVININASEVRKFKKKIIPAWKQQAVGQIFVKKFSPNQKPTANRGPSVPRVNLVSRWESVGPGIRMRCPVCASVSVSGSGSNILCTSCAINTSTCPSS